MATFGIDLITQKEYLFTFSGLKGDTGASGVTTIIYSGLTVFTGVTPTVVNSWYAGNTQYVSIYTPSGATGAQGVSGATGASGYTPTLSFTGSGSTVVNYSRIGNDYFVNIYAPSGATGAQGETGASGLTVVNYYTFLPSGGTRIGVGTGNTITIYSPTGGSGNFSGYTFVESGGTQINVSGNIVTIYSAVPTGTTVTWNDVTGKPDLVLTSTFTGHTNNLNIHYPQSGITITESQVTNLVQDLAGKSNSGHTHSYTGLTITDKPTFTGSGGTTVVLNGGNYVIYSTTPTGTTASWNDVINKPSWLLGTTLQAFETGHTHSQYITGSTATAPIIIQLIDVSGDTDVNVISGVSINWTTQEISGSSYLFTGGSRIHITQSGVYDIAYAMNVYNQSGGTKNIGTVIRKNSSVDITATSSTSQMINIENKSGTNLMPHYKVNLLSGDYVELIAFRIGDVGVALTKPNGSWITMIK